MDQVLASKMTLKVASQQLVKKRGESLFFGQLTADSGFDLPKTLEEFSSVNPNIPQAKINHWLFLWSKRGQGKKKTPPEWASIVEEFQQYRRSSNQKPEVQVFDIKQGERIFKIQILKGQHRL